jgi:hypothetical protein
MSAQTLVLLGTALAVIALERLVSAMLIVPGDGEARSIRILTAFVCGGLAPVFLVFGCFKRGSHKTP